MTKPSQAPKGAVEAAPEKRATVAALAQRNGSLNDWLLKQRGEIAKALPRLIDPDQFIRICLTTVKQDEYLLEADPASFLAAVFEAAQAGLVIDGVLGQAYLVSFYSAKRGVRLVTMIPGYRGLMELARRSGEVAKIEVRAVRPGDRFRVQFGVHQRLEHEPVMDGDVDPDAWTHVYAIAWFKDPNTPPQFEVMGYRQVMLVKARSAAAARGKSPWDTDELAMAMKTVIRRLCKMLPLAVADQRVVAKEDSQDAGLRQAEFEVKAPPVSTVDELAPAPKEAAPLTEEEMRAADAAFEARNAGGAS